MGPFSYLSMFSGFLLNICQLTERETIPGYLTCLLVCEMFSALPISVMLIGLLIYWCK